ncbi:thiamine pyrophosphate-binding protein [Marinicrinis sediminis]|uniref:Thiamine pyrophosphate-binding protein n=1 Tax=Marinicrinis sediminis TaxID=1652465 RepID=A0ABW5RER0_9BACL
MPSVSQLCTSHLVKWGITHVFGIPGKPVTPLVLHLDEAGIRFVLCKHEEGAGLAASGYAMTRQSLGVAIGTAGPGGTNMLTAAGQAMFSHLPVLFITGSPPICEAGKVLGQDSTMFGTDLVKMFEPVTKFSARVDRGELFQCYLEHAMEQAFTGVRGPVHLCIPLDVLSEDIEPFELDLPLHYPQVMASNLHEVASLLSSAKQPMLLAGAGLHARHMYRELEQFAEKWSIPVATTPGGKGVMRSDHPLSLGPLGLGGHDAAEAYLTAGVDVMVVAGSQLSDLELAGIRPEMYPSRIIHFDYQPQFIGKAIPVPTTPVIGDIQLNLQALLSMDSASSLQIAPLPEVAAALASEKQPEPAEGPLQGQQVMQVLREELPDDALMYGDAGSHSFYAIKYFDIRQPGTFYFEEVYATMGRAIGYAVGAKLADPNRTVVCLTGDGCMFMNGTEVSTAVNYQAPVLFLVANNHSLDMVDKGMGRHLGRAVGTTYTVPLDSAQFGQSMGADGYRCTTSDELRSAIQQALKSDRVSVIDIRMDPHEIPPTMKRG